MMQKSTIDSLQSLAPYLLSGKIPYPSPAYCQHAVRILKILQDNNWHTAGEIAKELGIGQKYARDILRACKEPWGLTSSKTQGWMLAKPN